MSTKTNTITRNGHSKVAQQSSILSRALTKSEWSDKVSLCLHLIGVNWIKVYAIHVYSCIFDRRNSWTWFTGRDRLSAFSSEFCGAYFHWKDSLQSLCKLPPGQLYTMSSKPYHNPSIIIADLRPSIAVLCTCIVWISNKSTKRNMVASGNCWRKALWHRLLAFWSRG